MELLVISNLLLWVVIMLMACIIYALARQIGILYERVAPAGALAVNRKLQAGSDAPPVSVKPLNGDVDVVGGKPEDHRSKLLFFLSPDCPVCKTLLPTLKSAAKAEAGWLDVILVSDGEEQDHNKFISNHGLQRFPYIVSELPGMTYGVSKLPYAVLIDETGTIASLGIINSREHLDSLFEAKERKVASIQDYVQRHQLKKQPKEAG
ncbi:MAG: redoxin domain-containing protein [Gammaproteobacteria bacterium]